jgi:hypothetical protein
MAGQAALLTRETVKSTIKSVECNAGKFTGGGKMVKKAGSDSKSK